MLPCGQSTMTSWARRNFRCVYTHFWCIHYRTGHQWFDLHLSVDFCRHEWIGLICRAPHRLCQQASILVYRSFNFFLAMLESPSMDVKFVATVWYALFGVLSLWFCVMCVFVKCVYRFHDHSIWESKHQSAGSFIRSLLLCISIDTVGLSRGGAREE